MGDGYRLICQLYPDTPRTLALVDEINNTLTYYACHCGVPLHMVLTDFGSQWECPQHGPVGFFVDGGELDLGIVRDSALARNDVQLFDERFVQLEGGTLDWGAVTNDGRYVEGHDDASLRAFLSDDGDPDDQ